MRNTKNILPLLILLSLFFVSCDFHVYGIQEVKGVNIAPDHVVKGQPFSINIVGSRIMSTEVEENYFIKMTSRIEGVEDKVIESHNEWFWDIVLDQAGTYYCTLYSEDNDKRHKINEFSYNFIVEVHEE